MSENVNFIVIV